LKITLIITAIIFIYAAFSTLFHETALVGDIGKRVGETNLFLFGYFAYIDIFLFSYPLYKIFRDTKRLKELDFYLGWFFFFMS